MISQEARDLFAANVAAMTAGDAPHLAAQVLPEGVERRKDVAYLDDGAETHLLDVYTLADADADAKLPVIVDFHGGGLYYGSKENNECRDMLLARQGFAVVNANYGLVPSVSFPTQLKDAMAVLDWVRDHGAEYGLDAGRVCVTGDSAGGALALYLTAANGSPQLAGALGLTPSGVDVKALVVTSGMFRLSGGVHATALSYYMEGYLQTPADHIKVDRYLDLDRLVVDGAVPPVYMITSVEDFIADNTYELARILHARHKDHAMSVWPKGDERALGHVFNIVQAGDPDASEAHQVVRDIAGFCKRYI
ncbi:alpha/beta hydrolase [Bifidobacterium platyrrhinorum]|uniref:Alpha/beta hydrolase fold domain-containing protein n=1 Tax=Bifidobacterium platyrrhinorum TaxID=2661628 RepID=A0A6L9STI2_9BIFI|nr:alpha/beta hydrolase [Bifidobacterium platyrrhinorum]NEG55880.1 alpha/beta hydrolase fold domain-containing protein [Bifidobacterium platyrrhinorum]